MYRPASSTAQSPSSSTSIPSKSLRYARTSKPMAAMPRLSSAATGRLTQSGAISRSTRCRLDETALSSTIPAASTISRIAEDYLRILRFFRFHAAYGTSDHPDPAGLVACIQGRDGLDQLSRERVRMEMMKLVVAPHAVPTLISMTDAGLLLRVLGGVSYLGSFENMAKVEAAIGAEPNAVRRLGALAVAIPEDADRLWQRLRLANSEHERLASMGESWGRISPLYGERAAKALLYRLRPQQFTDRVLLGWARSQATAHDAEWHALATL